MKRRAWLLKVAVVVNALVLVAAFVGCPWRRNGEVVPPTIAPPPPHLDIMPPSIASPPAHMNIMPPTIAPPTDHFERVVPPAESPAMPTQPDDNVKRPN
jgi:hypothetical protein